MSKLSSLQKQINPPSQPFFNISHSIPVQLFDGVPESICDGIWGGIFNHNKMMKDPNGLGSRSHQAAPVYASSLPLSCVINMILTDIHIRHGSCCLHINHLNGQVWLMVLKLVCHRMSCPEGRHGAEVRAVCFRIVLQGWTGGIVAGIQAGHAPGG